MRLFNVILLIFSVQAQNCEDKTCKAKKMAKDAFHKTVEIAHNFRDISSKYIHKYTDISCQYLGASYSKTTSIFPIIVEKTREFIICIHLWLRSKMNTLFKREDEDKETASFKPDDADAEPSRELCLKEFFELLTKFNELNKANAEFDDLEEDKNEKDDKKDIPKEEEKVQEHVGEKPEDVKEEAVKEVTPQDVREEVL
ncbi:hypothetical protein EDEG_00001 [Edhazardia aedis USNM 41457]|uniref:Uncharacterized protein n=1 Tax=Edhazardia aedis (strain USNM 41457) TaxID=1003232 RepID=J9DVT4_EDHAE|nr:hypothetical protein EDEG_00001 [Edhazardia aedis USNM 41457]|eukprot:EJW05392.1 hypothetical protein EDEG_00001 [Edhazardia aedis USNM 41457]